MTDREKIKAEVERLLNSPAPSYNLQREWEDGYRCALRIIEGFIDELT